MVTVKDENSLFFSVVKRDGVFPSLAIENIPVKYFALAACQIMRLFTKYDNNASKNFEDFSAVILNKPSS